MQQILAGAFKGKSLVVAKGKTTRPTLAIMRKALFDILQQEIEGADVLDLFAGSGSIGLEALSRGARSATFVESDRGAIQAIKKNIKICQAEDTCTIMGYDVFLALDKLSARKNAFDLVYIDPPYALAKGQSFFKKLLQIFDTQPLLKPGGRLFIEEASPGSKIPELSCLTLINSRRFSNSLLHQFQQSS